MKSRTAAMLLGLVGLVLLTGALILTRALPEQPTGQVATVEQSLGGPVAPGPVPTTSPAAEPAAPPLLVPNQVSRLDDLADIHAAPAPVSLSIGAIGVEAVVAPYGVNPRTGQMAVPRNVSEVAWYQHGPAPGQPGSAVLAAHVDLVNLGKGVFFDLKMLAPGDTIVVGYEDGSVTRFEVVGRVTYEKSELPVDVIFSRAGPPVLTLVTCGGGFNETAQSYDSNVVVYAVPFSDSQRA